MNDSRNEQESMCDRLYSTDTGEEIETQIGMMLLVGIELYRKHEGDDPAPDRCLCDVRYEAMLTEAGYVYHPNNGDSTDLLICRTDGPTLNPAPDEAS